MNPDTVFSEHSVNYQIAYRKYLPYFKDRIGVPTIHLEIGVYEGSSAILMLDNILTHMDSVYIGIDDNVRDVTKQNLKRYKDKAVVIAADSNVILPGIVKLVKGNLVIDTVYIDGCHHTEYVLNDIRNCMKLLKHSGIMLVDDYLHPEYELKELVDRLLLEYGTDIEVMSQGYMLVLKKC